MRHPVHLYLKDGSKKTIYVEDNLNLLEALRKENCYIRSSCGGHASCSDCVIKITRGEDYLNAPTFEEIQLLGNVFHITKERLACQSFVCGETVLDISSHDQSVDQQRLQNKNQSFLKNRSPIKVRKKADYEKIKKERYEKGKEKDEKKEEWRNHWEKQPKDQQRTKRLGGGKRPQPFQISNNEGKSEDPKPKDGKRSDFQKQRKKSD